ncbi:hypothetical protein L593_09520 [Salinarchaeum sp. Harcht-Bsk1]|uniref:SdpI family protein n=1 Tax=Salinarchaeum sp. Harcht-Bsk1 TaxID=1333523 RepID=UPI00034240A7|nr:SdpI family protein [Salinarchaeum sp. Harcht-Bsk1]AGN01849.1 hypothetical protein L593_09520 [Salinarchaeum sp. Harcht-Bsk1]
MRATVSTRTTRYVGGGLVLLGVLAGVLAWPELPATMDVHWNASGEADGTAPRAVGALLLPAVAAILLGVFDQLPRIDPLGENVADFRGYYDGFVLLLVAFLIGVHGVVLAANLGFDVPLSPVVLVATGGFLAYVGLLMRHAEPNWFVGVRTPWTLSSEEVWRRTHALAGWLFALAGVALAVAGVLGWLLDAEGAMTTAVLGIVLVASFVPVGYSYYLYRSLGGPEDAPA